MNQVASRIGKTLAFVLPVVLVLSGTVAVISVPWAPSASEGQVLASSDAEDGKAADHRSPEAPQEVLRRRLLTELQEKDPGVALTSLQQEMAKRPSLAQHCMDIARSLGRAAVDKYDGAAHRAQAWSRPVCDTSFATGVASVY